MSHAACLQAAQSKSASKKKTTSKHTTTAKQAPATTKRKTAAAPHASQDEIRRAGDLASENADRIQSEKMDPTVKETEAEQRVHQWLRDHHKDVADETKTAAPRKAPAKASARATAAADKPAAQPASSAGKATAADFDAAASKQQKAEELKPGNKPRSAVEQPDDPKDSTDAQDTQTATVAKQIAPTKKPVSRKAAAAEEKPVAAAKKSDDDDNTEDAQDDDDVAPAVRTAILQKDSRGHIIVPEPLRGSHAILIHQNVMADKEGLDRVQDDDHLDRLRRSKLLLPLPSNAAIHVDPRLTPNRRYARPWTVRFLNDMAAAHYQHFHEPLQINSAVRTVAFQKRLMRTNGNAAPPTGETASPHLTGQAVDLAKHGLSMTEIAWMRGYLLPLVQQGKIDVEEEFQQACFHISVYKAYLPQQAPKRRITSKRVGSRMVAATIP